MRRSSRRAPRVRMLCRRSASLMTMTRMSLLMATNILRMVAACSSVRLSTSMRVIFVTPSTSCATWGLNSASTWSRVTLVSSTVSCSSAAHSVSTSMRKSARMMATSTGCATNGSPLLRHWPSCASLANRKAFASMASSSSDRYTEVRRCSSANRSSGVFGARASFLASGANDFSATCGRPSRLSSTVCLFDVASGAPPSSSSWLLLPILVVLPMP